MSEPRRSRSASVAKEQAPQAQVGKAQEQEQEQEKKKEKEQEKEAGEKEAGGASGKEATAGGSGVGRKGEKRPAKGNVSGSGTTKTAAAQRGDAKGKGKAKAVEVEELEEELEEDEDTEGEFEGEDEAEAQAEAAKVAQAQAVKVGGTGSSSRMTGGIAPTATMSQRNNAPMPMDDDQDVIVQDHPKLWTNQPAQLSHDNTTEAQLAKQRLGYAFVNLLDPEIRFSWGRYVNRAIDKAHVKKLKDSFEQGIMNWKSQIPIMLDEDCVDLSSLSNEGVAWEDINMARWRTAAKRKTVLRERWEELQKKLDKERAKLKEKYLDEKKAETKQGKAQRERLAEIERLEEEIKRTGYWLVCFYKQDGFMQAHGEYTSQNDDKPSKHQGGVERVVGWCMQTQEFVSRMEDPPEIGTPEWINGSSTSDGTRRCGTAIRFLLRLSGFRYLRDGTNVTFLQLRTVGDSMNGGFGHCEKQKRV
ncbi:hypothetical protein GY45DRAFT_1341352 [Cubamyces sp. BRFM 1775]|nr:hypothetical protein GY45DRAFT_1341352 [Cubamyces sp. BRFM 1775]